MYYAEKFYNCKKDVVSFELKNIEGTSLVSGYYATIWQTLDKDSSIGKVIPGKKFIILESYLNYWKISYNNKCGWVDSNYMAINLKDYISESEYMIKYKIVNASKSIYNVSGEGIPKLTGIKLYSDEFKSFVPLAYTTAVKLKKIVTDLSKDGYTLYVYDTYRPYSVTKKIYRIYSEFIQNQEKKFPGWIYNNIIINLDNDDENNHEWGKGWFLSKNVSTHNTASAIDVSLKGYKMPSKMHDLTTRSVKYIDKRYNGEKYFSVGMQNSEGAKILHKYMIAAGFDELKSEWWHYQDTETHNRIKNVAEKGADFWNNENL